YLVIARAMAGHGKEKEAGSYYGLVLEAAPAQQEAVAYVADRLRGKKHRELRDLLFDAARVETGDAEQRRVWLSEVAEICEGPLRDVDGAIEARRQLVLLDPSDDE